MNEGDNGINSPGGTLASGDSPTTLNYIDPYTI